MNILEKQLIENFLNNADPKNAKNIKKILINNSYYSEKDILLGISMSIIKEKITSFPKFEITCLETLLNSEYNELRILGWGLLVRDYNNNIEILHNITLNYALYSNNSNVVDFAAPLISKYLLKFGGKESVHSLGYSLLFQKDNIWSLKFALMLSIPLIQNQQFNYSLDVVERLLHIEEEFIQHSCGLVLNEVKKQNTNLFFTFMNINKFNISNLTRNIAIK